MTNMSKCKDSLPVSKIEKLNKNKPQYHFFQQRRSLTEGKFYDKMMYLNFE